MISWIEKYLRDDVTGSHSLSRLGVAAAVITLAVYVLIDAGSRMVGGPGLDSASVMMAMGGLTTVATGGYAVNRITGAKIAQADADQAGA